MNFTPCYQAGREACATEACAAAWTYVNGLATR